jgi:hypothetical protein
MTNYIVDIYAAFARQVEDKTQHKVRCFVGLDSTRPPPPPPISHYGMYVLACEGPYIVHTSNIFLNIASALVWVTATLL